MGKPKKSKSVLRTIVKALSHWHQCHGRMMPWVISQDPYLIWIAEIIMQQTRIEQGMPYYKKFISKYPTIPTLANATLDEVLLQWQGLGYYSRARNIHFAANQIMEKFDGRFPDNYHDIISLKGIGPYTAAAILSFAYNRPFPVMDGNVTRVISRLFGIDEDIDKASTKRIIIGILQDMIPNKNAGEFNQSMMDFGAMQCTPSTPCCGECPLNDHCYAYKKDLIHLLPVKRRKTTKRKRFFHYFFVLDNLGKILIKKRPKGDIWQGLYDFPCHEEMSPENHSPKKILTTLFPNISATISPNIFETKHILTHQDLLIKIYKVHSEEDLNNLKLSKKYLCIDYPEINNFPIPVVLQKYLETQNFNLTSIWP